MPYDLLRVRAAGAGLLAACLMVGCGGDTPPSSDADRDTDVDEEETPERDAGKSDAGKSDAGAGKQDGGTDGSSGGSDKGKGLPCEVQAILESRCGECHGEKPAFGAPSSLVTAADFQATASTKEKMFDAVKTRINQSDPRLRMPPASSTKLSAAELETLNEWLDDGAKAGTETCSGGGTDGGTSKPPPNTEGLECYQLTAHAGDLKTPFKVGVANDAYFNFTYRAPWTETVYGVTFRPIIDNTEVIHHWLLFQDDVPGTPGITPSIGAHPAGQLLTGWAPGGEAVDLSNNPDDIGVEMPGNTTYTVEYHYNSSNAQAVDASGVEICVRKTKPKNIAGLSWLGYDQLAIPAIKWTGTCAPFTQQPIHLLSVTPHMHKMGTHMKATINRRNGTKEVLHDEPFDFNYQRGYDKVGVTLMPGDTITTECTFGRPMAFGESTDAEMCYLFTLAYPKGALADLGLWGRFAHGGSSCLGQ